MRRFGKVILALGVAALAAAPAQAQQGRGFGRFGGGGGGFGTMLLSNKGVQKELKATDEQAEKLNALGEQLRSKQREAFQKLQELSDDERREKGRELFRTAEADLRKGLADVLKPEQVKRFEQIQLQASGPGAFASPRVEEALKLTDDQKGKIRTVNDELGQSIRDAFEADRENAFTKIAELRKGATEKAVAVLNDDQKKTWKELTGEPFEVKFEAPRRPN